jgi:hypothetical protein
MQTRQAKTHSPKLAAKTTESTQKAASSAAGSTRLPAWTSAWEDQPPAGLAAPVPELQAKHAISQPGDPSEQEADQVSDQVMRMAALGSSSAATPPEVPEISLSFAASVSPIPPMIQRAPAEGATSSSTTAAPASETAPTSDAVRATSAPENTAPNETPTPGLIVEDSVDQLGPGQMKKSDFLAQLRSAVCTSTEEALAGTIWSAAGCPWVDHWFGYYSNRDSQQIERAIRRYAPETAHATSASDYIPIICERVRRAIAIWSTTGEITGVPEGMELPGAGLMGTIGTIASGIASVGSSIASGVESVASGVASAGASLVSGVGSALSSISSMLFKRREGGAREVSNPQAIQGQLGDGRSLDGGVRSHMESVFGVDFSHVRVHTDATAGGLSENLNARAFTIGLDVDFGPGEYRPGTLVGDALIAHELAHVVQQGGASASAEPMQKGGEEYNALEEDADMSAVGVVISLWSKAGGVFANIAQNTMPTLKSGLGLQRCAHTGVPAVSGPVSGGSYVWQNLVLKAMVDGASSKEDIITYINGLSPADRDRAIHDLERGRADYVEHSLSRIAITKMDQVLQSVYRRTAQTQAPGVTAPVGGWPAGGIPGSLLTGTRAPTAAEKTEIAQAMTPALDIDPVTGTPPRFRSHIPAGNYETRIRSFVASEIDREYLSLVVGRGPAEHADPSKVYPMSRFREIGNAAKGEVDQVFSSYAIGPTFTPGVNLFDRWEQERTRIAAMSPAEKLDTAKFRVSKILRSERGVYDINREHNAIPGRTTLSPGEFESEATILERIRNDLATANEARLLEIHRGWPGASGEGKVFIQRFKQSSDDENRRLFWDTFQIMIHEYLHSLTHHDYETYALSFGGTSTDQYQTLVEGMTSVLTEIVWNNVAPKVSMPALRSRVEGVTYAGLPFDETRVPPISRRRYPSYAQAMEVVSIAGIRNVYAAYFLGRVDLIHV